MVTLHSKAGLDNLQFEEAINYITTVIIRQSHNATFNPRKSLSAAGSSFQRFSGGR